MDKIKTEISGTWWICLWLGLILVSLNGIRVELNRIANNTDPIKIESAIKTNMENK